MTNNLDRNEVTAGQNQKEVTINESDGFIDSKLTELATLDFTAGNITLTDIQWQRNATLVCTNVVAARVLTTPVSLQKGFSLIDNSAGANEVTVTRGSGTVAVPAGEVRLVYQDGTTNGLVNAGGGGGGGSSTSWPLNDQSGTTYTFVPSDAGSLVRSTNVAATVFTIDDFVTQAIPVGSWIRVLQGAAGALTITADTVGGVTLDGNGVTGDSVTLSGVNAGAVIYHQASDVWIIEGNIDVPLDLGDYKTSVRVATTVNGALATAYEDTDIVDGITLATGDRILLKNQTAGAENGIYTVNATGAPTRAVDFDAIAIVTPSLIVAVEEGDANCDTMFMLTNDGTITIATTALTFGRFGPDKRGTFTPTVDFSTTGDFVPTYTAQEGFYTRQGDVVHINVRLVFDTNAYTTATGQLEVGGLPFIAELAASLAFEHLGAPYLSNVTFGAGELYAIGLVEDDNTVIKFWVMISAAAAAIMDVVHFPASTTGIVIRIGGTYRIKL